MGLNRPHGLGNPGSDYRGLPSHLNYSLPQPPLTLVPQFLEDKLKKEYPGNDAAVYGTLNNIGAMHGNKITPKGREMERKHEAKMSGQGRYRKGRL
jgi:hypothetical protein